MIVEHDQTPFPSADGEGFERWSGPDRIKTGGVARAQRLRATPTHAEAKLWDRLRRLKIRVRRQVPIGPYVVDFACLRAKLVIEVDGGVHQRTDIAVRDIERDAWLTRQGFRVIRIPNARVEDDLDAVVTDIQKAIQLKVPASKALPLEGEGLGWGGGSAFPNEAREALSESVRPSPSVSDPTQSASTPPNPPPRGEGFKNDVR
ncbi:endonuclease domain-containing protein [Brevundimonas sp.]